MAYKQNNYRRNFLNTSLNYSEVNQFKKEVLKPILQSCNESNKKSLSKANVFDKDKYLVPNNNNKYYLLVCNKSNSNNKYKTLYFNPSFNFGFIFFRPFFYIIALVKYFLVGNQARGGKH